MHLWRGGLFDKLSLLSSNLALFSHHMDRGSEVIGVLNLYNKYTAFIGRCYMLHWSSYMLHWSGVIITSILVFEEKIHGCIQNAFLSPGSYHVSADPVHCCHILLNTLLKAHLHPGHPWYGRVVCQFQEQPVKDSPGKPGRSAGGH